jgi:hypothetical protein
MKRQNVALVAAFRCNPMVTALLRDSCPPGGSETSSSFTRATRSAIAEAVAAGGARRQAEKGRLIEPMRLRFARGETVAVLLPRKNLVFGYAKGFREAVLTY